MKHKFSVGDKVRILRDQSGGKFVGTITSVIGEPFLWNGILHYPLDMPPDGNIEPSWFEEWIEAYYDGHEPASWSDCVWQPKQIHA